MWVRTTISDGLVVDRLRGVHGGLDAVEVVVLAEVCTCQP